MTNADRIYILELHRQGKTQTEIGQQLGFTQPAISDWLAQCKDSTIEAKTYLRGQSLQMARKIVRKGKPSDLVSTLKGTGVLEEQANTGVTVLVGYGGVANFGPAKPELEPALDVQVSPVPALGPGER
jgi:hypothetical protein